MAGIDKLYAHNLEQCLEFNEYCQSIKDNCRKSLKYPYDISEYLYFTAEYITKYYSQIEAEEIKRLTILSEILKLPKDHEDFIKQFASIIDDQIHYEEDYIEDVKNRVKFYDETEKINVCIPIANFPLIIDRYLIQNCPLDWVQDRLKEQYSSSYESIRSNTDDYSKPYVYEPSKKIKLFYTLKPKRKFCAYSFKNKLRYIKCRREWEIETVRCTVTGEYWWYSEFYKKWFNSCRELVPEECCDFIYGGKTFKALLRRVKKWKLPANIRITVRSPYFDESVEIYTK